MFENKYQQNDCFELLDAIKDKAGSAPCEQFPDAFHPSVGEPDLTSMAKALCADCPVIAMCLQYGIKWENEGIYGGKTPHERAITRGKLVKAGHTFDAGMRVRKVARAFDQTTN